METPLLYQRPQTAGVTVHPSRTNIQSPRRLAKPRTPRNSPQSSTAILPLLPQSSSSAQLLPLRKSFMAFTEEVNSFLIHNGSTFILRKSLSTSIGEMERTFATFYGQLANAFTSETPTITPSLESTTASFTQEWKTFTTTLFSIGRTPPISLIESLSQHIQTISDALESITKLKSLERASNIRQLQTRLLSIQRQSFALIESDGGIKDYRPIAEEVKAFSRALNSGFATVVERCTVSQNEITRHRAKCYASCSDIIQTLRSLATYDTDYQTVAHLYDETQTLITTVLEKIGYVPKPIEESPPEEPPLVISVDADLNELLKILEDRGTHEQLLQLLRSRIDEIKTSESNLLKDLEHQRREMEDFTKQSTETELNLQREIEGLNARIGELEEKIDEYKLAKSNNPFKDCLYGVARKLGAVMKEEEMIFDQQDDDELIKQVHALAVYVVEKKCEKCEQRNQFEQAKMDELRPLVGEHYDWEEYIDAAICKLKEEAEEKKDLTVRLRDSRSALSDVIVALGGEPDDETLYTRGAELVVQKMHEFDEEKEEIKHHNENDVAAITKEISQQLLRLVGDTGSEQTIDQMIYKLSNDLDTKKKIIAEKSAILEQAASAISRFLHTEKRSVPELVKMMDDGSNPVTKKIVQTETHNKNLIVGLESVYSRVCGICGQKISKKGDVPLVQQIIPLLDRIHNRISELEETIRLQKSDFVHYREVLEQVDLNLHSFLGLENTDLSQFNLKTLMIRVLEHSEKISHPVVSDAFVRKEEINRSLDSIFDLVPTTSRSEPASYAPEIACAFASLHRSILALKPFASILNDIFASFDCKFSSFNPSSESFATLKSNLSRLHGALGGVVPNRINSLVFVVLSRFTALTSSLVSALAALSFDPDDSSSQSFVYSLQRENERLGELVGKAESG